MFKNIGRWLKNFANVVAAAGVALCLVIGISGIAFGANQYETFSGWTILIGGTLAALVSGLLLYGFGELIETNQRMYKLMLLRTEGNETKPPVATDVWVCKECKNVNREPDTTCAKCGAYRG